MTVVHPFQSIVPSRDNSLLFVTSRNQILGFKYTNEKFNILYHWKDQYERETLLREKVIKEQKRQLAENAKLDLKKSKDNEGKPVVRPEPKIPTPGPGAPPIYSIVRNLIVSPDDTKLFACTDSDKAIIELSYDVNASSSTPLGLDLLKRQPYSKRPNAITITKDQKNVIMVDKFGDAFSMPIDGSPVLDINEIEPILGHVSMLTDVLMVTDGEGKQYIITSDRDEHIKISHYPQCFIVDKWLFGHKEFVSSLCSPTWKSDWLFSAGGDDNVFAWNWVEGKNSSKFNYSELIRPYLTDAHLAPARFQNETNDTIEYSVSKVVVLANRPFIAFFVEATKLLFIISVDKSTGFLALAQQIEMPYNIISLSSSASDDELQITLDNRDCDNHKHFAKFVTFDKDTGKFVVDTTKSSAFDEAVAAALKLDFDLQCEKADIYPLYNVTSLKKHGEHFS
ncbi:hypothetical protein NCAS_0B03330 [Naumovozyma castellii]|uniref:Uncharacterized protein n=1 Tax=Naumovozyma castellii TaxID=27288 RepID=G0VBU1_NAUCA|nr:hypothetical protein NCAS_0B03330 [Naumovozyma castellii CBS 4309]CCC68417.1 hypothetical protein NCAS_0B03330 [Naumovozyma castellii CBS 4309]